MSFVFAYDGNRTLEKHSWVIAVKNGRVLSWNDEVIHTFESIAPLDLTGLASIQLGYWHKTPCFLLVVDREGQHSFSDDHFVSLKACLRELCEGAFSAVSRAAQLCHWWLNHQYCGQCGTPTTMHDIDCMLHCKSCNATHYPVIAPCVIGVIRRGSQILLARNAQFREGLYSAIAGFIEPGESAEQALHREVAEEVGLKIKNLQYMTSQTWPFPSQLMLGFLAEYADGEIEVDGLEIVESDWFDVDNLPLTPPPETLSGKLIREQVQRIIGIEHGNL